MSHGGMAVVYCVDKDYICWLLSIIFHKLSFIFVPACLRVFH